jgi:hypothetical protein
MTKYTYILFINLFVFSSISIAQITGEEYNSEKKLLTWKRAELTDSIKTLKFEIDSLANLISEMKQILASGYRELFELKYGKEISQRIAYKRIWKGMTDNMVKDGWGEPDRIDKNVEPWGVFTQWIYGEIIFFFRDGKLTDWQEGPEN